MEVRICTDKKILNNNINYDCEMVSQNEYIVHILTYDQDSRCQLILTDAIIKCYQLLDLSSMKPIEYTMLKGKTKRNILIPKKNQLVISFDVNKYSDIAIIGYNSFFSRHRILGKSEDFYKETEFRYHCRGWINDNKYLNSYIYVCLRGKNFFEEIPLIKRRRPDVMEKYSSVDFLWCGYDFFIDVKSCETLRVSIVYYTSIDRKEKIIGRIKKNCNDARTVVNIEGKLNKSLDFYGNKHLMGSSMVNYYSIRSLFPKNSLLILKHCFGGGAEMFIQKKLCAYQNNRVSYITTEYIPDINQYKLVSYDGAKDVLKDFYFDDIFWFFKFIKFNIKEIWINELVSYPNVMGVLDSVVELVKDSDIKLYHYVHDYFLICPSINLLNSNGVYCGLPDTQKCQLCFNQLEGEEAPSIMSWREKWANFIYACDKVICFSNSSMSFVKKIYPKIKQDNIEVKPHTIEPLSIPNIEKNTIVTIGLLGSLTSHKGLNKIEDLVKYIDDKKLDIRIVLIGKADKVIDSDSFIETGKYTKDEIVKYVEKYKINVFFMSSIWPETFSYTVSEIMSMDIPLLSYDVGAQGERTRKYIKGNVVPLNATEEEIIEGIYKLV